MPTPFGYLKALTTKYAQEEINKIIEKYPHIAYTNKEGLRHSNNLPEAIDITGEMLWQEFNPIFIKLLDCAKEDLKGSPEADSYGIYSSKIEHDFYETTKGIYLTSCCKHVIHLSLFEILERKIFRLLNLCSMAIHYKKNTKIAANL
jgi:hypothetical protein